MNMAVTAVCQLPWIIVLLCVCCGRPSMTSLDEEVQEPFNLTIKSYNFNTTLHWDYNRMENDAYFCVELLDKVEKKWVIIEACQNISHHYCDLSYEITDPVSYYKVRVKALVGSKTSRPSHTEFSLSSEGIFGPPELDVLIKEKIIVVDIFHPEVPSIDKIKRIMEDEPLNYIVYFGNKTEKAIMCDGVYCTAEFPISYEGSYCFSAQGTSDYFLGMTMEKSQETCVQVKEGIQMQTVGIIIGVIVGSLAILVISCFIITRWTKPRELLPQSLSTFLNIPVFQGPTQRTAYDQVSSSQPVSPVEEQTYIEEKVKIYTDESNGFVSKESTDPGYQSSLTENEHRTDEKGSDQSNSNSYFHTDSSTSGINSCDLPESVKEEEISELVPEAPKEFKPLPSSFGYDKPHFPK